MPGAIWVQFCERVILNLHWIIRDSKVNSLESLFSVNESCHAAWMQSWRRLMIEYRVGCRGLQTNLLQGHIYQIWLKTTLGVRWLLMLDYQMIPTSPRRNIHFYKVQKNISVCMCVILTVHPPPLGNRNKNKKKCIIHEDTIRRKIIRDTQRRRCLVIVSSKDNCNLKP